MMPGVKNGPESAQKGPFVGGRRYRNQHERDETKVNDIIVTQSLSTFLWMTIRCPVSTNGSNAQLSYGIWTVGYGASLSSELPKRALRWQGAVSRYLQETYETRHNKRNLKFKTW